jgi:hypothetical protein
MKGDLKCLPELPALTLKYNQRDEQEIKCTDIDAEVELESQNVANKKY